MAQLMCTTTMVNNVVVVHDIVYKKATRIATQRIDHERCRRLESRQR